MAEKKRTIRSVKKKAKAKKKAVVKKTLEKTNYEQKVRIEQRTTELVEINKQLKREIKERKGVEVALRDSEERFRLAFEYANVGVCIVDMDGNLIRVNNQMSDIFGYDKKELESMTVNDIAHPEDKDLSPTFIKKSISGEVNSIVFEKRYFHKQGHIIWGQVSSTIIKNTKGNPLCFISHVQDFTKRKHAEEALEKKTFNLNERVKELNCLYNISRLVDMPDVTLEKILQGTVNLIPPSWQYPKITCAQIIIDGQEFKTKNFKETDWVQYSEIMVYNKRIGVLKVCYLEEKPEIDEGPFLKEERDLINANAERLGHIIEKMRAEEALKKTHDELESRVEKRTAELFKSNEKLKREIEERKRVEKNLRKKENELRSKSNNLIEANAALKVLLRQRENDKRDLEESVLSNVKLLIQPAIERLKHSRLTSDQKICTQRIDAHLEKIVSPFLKNLDSKFLGLTPLEIKISSLIKEGNKTKEIAQILYLSVNTVTSYRYHLRCKLGLRNKKTNLYTYLQTLSH